MNILPKQPSFTTNTKGKVSFWTQYSIKVRKDESESDYSANVEQTFEKFKQGAVKSYAATFTSRTDMNHVEAIVLDFVAKLYPHMM